MLLNDTSGMIVQVQFPDNTIKTYRFEGESDPSDSSILYVMEANDGSIGYSVDAYGAFSNHDDVDYNGFIVKVPIEEREEQLLFTE